MSQSECSVMTGWCWVGWSASDYMCPPSRYVIVIVRDICGYWFGKAMTIWEWLRVSWWWVELSDCLFSGFEIVTCIRAWRLCDCMVVSLYMSEWMRGCGYVCMTLTICVPPSVPVWGACDSSILTLAEPVKTVALGSDRLNLYDTGIGHDVQSSLTSVSGVEIKMFWLLMITFLKSFLQEDVEKKRKELLWNIQKLISRCMSFSSFPETSSFSWCAFLFLSFFFFFPWNF